MATEEGYGGELPGGYVRRTVPGQRVITREPRTGERRAPAPATDPSVARANALLNPIMQYSFRAGSEGGGSQYQYAGQNTPLFFGEALRRFQQTPNRVYGNAPPPPSNVGAGPTLGQTQPGETDYQRMLRIAKMAGF